MKKHLTLIMAAALMLLSPAICKNGTRISAPMEAGAPMMKPSM